LPRPVTIVADDYGIGRETSRAILELAIERRITATVLIVNAPDAERAAREWLVASPPADLGWHPNLTLDRPVSAPNRIPTLVRPDGSFWPLAPFLKRVVLKQISAEDVRTELAAQFSRFVDLVGTAPKLVNSHQHVSLLPPCDVALLDVFAAENCRPYLRRIVERPRSLANMSGERLKRTFLSLMGHRAARRASARNLPGCDWLVGISNRPHLDFLSNCLSRLGDTGSVEIYCHPGYRDDSLIGRDGDAASCHRRPHELAFLRSPVFDDAIQKSGMRPIRPSQFNGGR
jgi:predicted glycoside hydrolase/deacetylase ChbG (UPF0249 family)